MTRPRLSPEKTNHSMIPRLPFHHSAPRSLPGVALRELPLHAAPLPGLRDGGSPAACRIHVENVGESFRVTERLLCRVPVANDVRACGCGGVFSDLFNGRSLCRGCGRER